MKKLKNYLFVLGLAVTAAAWAPEKSISGIVAARLVQPDGSTTAFLLVDPAKPTEAVTAAGADAEALLPRNQITLSGSSAESPLGGALKVTAGSVKIGETNQPFKSQPITAAAFKDASANTGNYVQLAGVTFVADKFDNSGTAQVKADDGTVVSLLVGKGVAGRETPKGKTDVFGVVVKSGGDWKLVAARFLPANRKAVQELATKATCMTCHNPDARVVAGTPLLGPPYREVAAKYRNDPDAASKLIAQMKTGGQGKWGQVPMPPLAAVVQPDDMQKLADWILGYRWDAILAE
jgi:cytochrome c551/c552